MKTKTPLFALIVGIFALSAPAEAGSRHGGSGQSGESAPSGGGPPGSARSFSRGNFSGARMMAPGRFSATGARYYSGTMGQRSFARTGAGSLANRQARFAAVQSGRTGGGTSNHVFAQRPANWHSDWNRNHDHWWHGHRCRFVNGSWFIFDAGFYPWWGFGDPYWYGYYPYDYYPYGYDPGYDQGGPAQGGPAYDQSGGYSSAPAGNGDSTVAAAQERLAREGYYHGNADGVFGPETRRAVRRFQSDRGLRVTGYLTADTVASLGLRREAAY